MHTTVIIEAEAEQGTSRFCGSLTQDFDGTFLQNTGQEFVGPPTLTEWRHEMYCSLYDPCSEMTDAELHALLVMYK